MADLASIFATAQTTVEQLVTTSGTVVDVLDIPDEVLEGDVDPDTLDVTLPAATPIATELPAIVAPAGQGSQVATFPSQVDARPGDYLVLLTVDNLDPDVGHVVHVTDARDPGLVGLRLRVRSRPDSSAGVARLLVCHPVERKAYPT